MTERFGAYISNVFRVKVSLFCVVGIIVGIMSLVAVWSSCFFYPPAINPLGSIDTGIDVAEEDYLTWIETSIDTDQMRFGVLVVILGLAIGLITPLGGIAVIVGAVVFIQAAPDYMFWGAIHGGTFERRIGPFIAILSGSVMVLSCLVPVWLGHVSNDGRFTDRFMTMRFARASQKGGSGPEDHVKGTKPAPLKAVRKGTPRMVALLASAVLILAALALALHDYTSKESGKVEIVIINDLDSYINFTVSVGDLERGIGMGPRYEMSIVGFFEAGAYELRVDLIDPWVDSAAESFWLLPLESERFSVSVADGSFTVS